MEELKQLLRRYQRRVLKLTIFLTPVLSTLVIAGLLVGDLERHRYQPATTSVDSSAQAQAQLPPPADPRNRPIQPIFGNYQSEQEKAAQNRSKIPTTSLNLTLHAIFYSTESSAGAALISKQGRQKAALYRIGNAIMNGVRLEQVLIDSVVINRNGNSESLRLPRLGKKKT